ncbi:hypothetical protein M405DRAFT_695184, partial [Rhizopogon salebrosus TDB-379]
IIRSWQEYFTILKEDMAIRNIAHRHSFTNDIWSNDACRPYLGMTAHWVGQDKKTGALMLNVGLIAFH